MKISGGMSHSGTDTTSATSASKVDTSDHHRLASKEPPRLRSRLGNRFLATSKVSAGAIKSDTTISESTTMSGVTAKITISGASTAFRSPMPKLCIQPVMLPIRVEDSSHSRTEASKLSQ